MLFNDALLSFKGKWTLCRSRAVYVIQIPIHDRTSFHLEMRVL